MYECITRHAHRHAYNTHTHYTCTHAPRWPAPPPRAWPRRPRCPPGACDRVVVSESDKEGLTKTHRINARSIDVAIDWRERAETSQQPDQTHRVVSPPALRRVEVSAMISFFLAGWLWPVHAWRKEEEENWCCFHCAGLIGG